MLKATLFIWCLLLASSSYNAQFASSSHYNSHQEFDPYYLQFGGYPNTDFSSYHPSFYHPMYEQEQHYGLDEDEDEDEDYFTSSYFREPGIGRRNVTGKIGKPNRLNIAGRPSTGNRPNRPLGSKPTRPNIAARPGKPTRPIIGRPRPGVKPGVGSKPGEPGAGNKQRPSLFLNWLRRLLQRFIAILARLFPNLYSTVYSTQTFTETRTCTISTTACAGRRRRAFIEHLINHNTDDQLSTSITPESESSIAAMKLLSKSEVDPELYLDLFDSDYDEESFDYINIEGSMRDPEDEEDLKRLRKQLKMSPLKAAKMAKQLGLNTITIVTSTTTTFTTKLTPTCSTQGNISQCP